MCITNKPRKYLKLDAYLVVKYGQDIVFSYQFSSCEFRTKNDFKAFLAQQFPHCEYDVRRAIKYVCS